MPEDPVLLSRAIVVWTGWGETSWPVREQGRLTLRFGREAAVRLLPRIRELEDEFYASDAPFTISDLHQMGEAAADRFRRLHPEISDDAVRALAWSYTYDYK